MQEDWEHPVGFRTADDEETGGNILETNEESILNSPGNISLYELVARLSKANRERLTSGYDLKSFARIFEDADLMTTVDSFLYHGMNICETARKLYMHRNTLMYRLNKIRDETGLDIRYFDMAVTFEILRSLYRLK